MTGTTIFFDLETGGTILGTHPIIQIAAVAMKEGVEVGAFEVKLAFDEALCDPHALEVNGYKPEDWAKAVTPQHAARQFNDFCTKHADLGLISKKTGNPYTVARLGGHNVAAFDIPWTKAFMERHGVKFWKACWWYPLDTYQGSVWHFMRHGLPPPTDFQLQTLAGHFGIPAQGAAHEALADARLCARIAERLLIA